MKKSIIIKAIISGATYLAITFAAQADPFRIIVTHLQPPLVPNSVMDLAVDLGYFSREGIDVEIIRVNQTPLALAALLAGEGDMANISVETILQQRAQSVKGQLTKTSALKAVTSPNKSLPFLIASKDDIASPADLVGRTFGVGRIGSLDYGLSTFVLEANGVSMDSMEIVGLGQPSVRAQALVAGQIDATTMSIGTWLSIPDKSGIAILIPADEYFENAPVVNKVNVVSNKTLETRREDVLAVVRALIKISRDFANDPDAWANVMVPYAPELGIETLRKLAASFAADWSVNGGLGRTQLEFTQEWIYKSDDFKDAEPVHIDDWVDFTVVDEVLTELGTQANLDSPSR
jgi:NitT/TauT family transport system substrate-binding protein